MVGQSANELKRICEETDVILCEALPWHFPEENHKKTSLVIFIVLAGHLPGYLLVPTCSVSYYSLLSTSAGVRYMYSQGLLATYVRLILSLFSFYVWTAHT
jgi:hypothetical protein